MSAEDIANDARSSQTSLTAVDLMSRDPITIDAGASMRDASKQLAQFDLHGAPVVDEAGRCIGMLSVSDIARWASRANEPQTPLPRTCAFQKKCREPGGLELYSCQLAEGVCPFQRLRTTAKGGIVCTEPHSVPTDWQLVEWESPPGELVRDYMTTTPISVELDTAVPELVRVMLIHGVCRLVILDFQGRPTGIVSVSDLLKAIAQSFPGATEDCH